MDQYSTNVLAYCAFISSVGAVIVGAINHRRIRSNCCGREITSSIDIENTTPPKPSAPSFSEYHPPLQIRAPQDV